MKPLLYMLLCALTLQVVLAQGNVGSRRSTEPMYIIQPNDMLEIFVWKEEDLTRKVLVRPDGRISFPLVQDLQAAGISPTELKKRVEEKLSTFLSAPEVTIIVEAINSYRIYVLGKVQNPGEVSSHKPVTVLQALALAGGFADYAKDDKITVIRSDKKGHKIFNFNYSDVIRGKNTEQNIILKTGDTVNVP